MVHFYDLPENLLLQVIQYLSVPDTFSALSRVTKRFYSLISTEKFIPLTLLNQFIGNNFSLESLKATEYEDILRILQRIYKSNSELKELPFYAFKSNTGCDNNDPQFFFHHVFKPVYYQSVCPKEGSDFSIHGTLAYNYYEPLDLLHNANLVLNSQEKVQVVQHLSQRNGNIITDLLKNSLNSTYEYEIPYEPLTRFAIIKTINVSRRGGFTCPLKTMMLYTSNEKIEQDDPLVNLIGSPETIEGIRDLYANNPKLMPGICFTNIELLRPWAEVCTPLVDNDVSLIVFKNSSPENKANKAKPMIWMQFNNTEKMRFEVNLDHGNFFSGKFVLLKMINCDDSRVAYGDYHIDTNIDVNYISLRGCLL